nr:hypothetical protein [Clostridia bacterium]
MKILVFKDGNTRAVTGEEGKYWLTGEDRVRKLSAQIAEIREVPDEKPKKRTAKKKKAEDAADGERGE